MGGKSSSSSSSSQTTTYHDYRVASEDGGVAVGYGGQYYRVTTDHGAVAAGERVSKDALELVDATTGAAFNLVDATTGRAFDFAADSLGAVVSMSDTAMDHVGAANAEVRRMAEFVNSSEEARGTGKLLSTVSTLALVAGGAWVLKGAFK